MKRKINLVGKNTLTVSLPTDWTKKNNLKKGDDVDIVENGKDIVITTKPKNMMKKVSVKLLLGNEWYIAQTIRNLYTYGYDEVELTFDDLSIKNKIKKSLDNLPGYELIEETKTYCLIKAVTSPIDGSLDVLLRRYFLNTIKMFDDIIDDIAKNKNNQLEDFTHRRHEISRLMVLCRRLIRKNRPFSEEKNSSMLHLLARIGDVSSTLLYMYEYIASKKNPSISKDIIEYCRLTKEQYMLFYDILYKKNLDGLEKLNKNRELLIYGKLINIFETKKGHDIVIAHYCAEIIRCLAASGGSLLITILDR